MQKKGSLKLEGDFEPKAGDISSRGSALSYKAFAVIKFILGILLLPFVYSSSVAFLAEFGLIERSLQGYFWAGVVSFLAIYLFVWEPVKIYTRGQRILEIIFRFFAPLVRVAPYLLPIYFILIASCYFLLSLIVKSVELINYFNFFFGFSVIFHLVFSAKSIRSKQGDFLKANHIFGFSFIYIINLMLLGLFLSLIFEKFSFVNFLNYSFLEAKAVFGAVFKQFFL